jgi:hypothetical protein
LAPALPGRSTPASGSWLSSRKASSGSNPKPPLNVPAAPSFSECAPINVASMSMTICSGAAPAFHAISRARARAVRSAPSRPGSAAIASITRKAVAFEAPDPNSGVYRFHRRGRTKVRLEWRLLMMTHNLTKLHRHQRAAIGA